MLCLYLLILIIDDVSMVLQVQLLNVQKFKIVKGFVMKAVPWNRNLA